MHIVVEDGKVADLRFHGQGCAISQAAASITSEELIGMPVEEVGRLGADWVIDQLGIEISPTRRKCALLAPQGHARRHHRRRVVAGVGGQLGSSPGGAAGRSVYGGGAWCGWPRSAPELRVVDACDDARDGVILDVGSETSAAT